MNEQQFNIGDKFVLKRRVDFFYNEEGNRIFSFEPIKEQVYTLTGIRVIPLGKYTAGHGYSSMDGDEWVPPYLTITSTVKVALVTKGLRCNPIRVPFEDLLVARQQQ